MITDREPQSASAANQNTPGVRKLKPRLGRPNPYGVQWSERVWDPASKESKRKVFTAFFPDEKRCDQRYLELCTEKRNGHLATATRQEIAEWRAFQAATEGTPWSQVVAGWHAWLQHNGMGIVMPTVAETAKVYLERYVKLTEREQRSSRTYKKVKLHIERFVAQFGSGPLDKVTAEEVEDWLDDSEDIEAESTFNTYRRDLHAFFARFQEAGTLRRNPIDGVKLRDELNEDTGVLSIEDTARLLHTAQTYFDTRNGHRFRLILPRIAAETLGGLRNSSAQRMLKADVNFADKGITLPKRMLKTKRRHYVSGFPEVLWQWFALAEERAWEPIGKREYDHFKGELFTAAGVPHPPNCLRHGFASYLLAAKRDPGLVAYLLCHRNQDQLFDHYNGRVTAADGKRFLTLSPRVAAKLASTSRDVVPAAPPPGPA